MDFGGIGLSTVLLVALLVGTVAFFYSNLGLGGGQLYVPIMDLFFVGLVMKEIVPLSLVFAFVTMVSATYTHNKKGLVDFRLGLTLVAGGLVGVVVGVMFTTSADEVYVKAGFATLLLVVATKMIYDLYKARGENHSTPSSFTTRQRIAGVGVSLFTGVMIGSFGIGGGVVSVPLMVYVFKMESRRAIGTSAFVGALLTPAAFAAYWFSEGVDVQVDLALVLTPLIFVMALVGSTWGLAKLRTKTVRTIFIGGVYLAACEMVYSLLFC